MVATLWAFLAVFNLTMAVTMGGTGHWSAASGYGSAAVACASAGVSWTRWQHWQREAERRGPPREP